MNLFAIDPGKHAIGFAHFKDRELLDCRVIKFENLWRLRSELLLLWPTFGQQFVVCETPQVYPRERVKDPNDLIAVALTVGACLSLSEHSLAVRPHEWKGSQNKNAHQLREVSKAPPDVQAKFNTMPKTLRHNAIDAYLLGIWFLGRFAHRPLV